jgi:hypothetical protein
MADFFTSAQIAHLSNSTVRFSLLVEMAFDTDTVRLWEGNTVLTTMGHDWQPTHGRATIDGLSVVTGTASDAVTMTLSGVPDSATDLLALALEESPEVSQRLCKIFIQLFDDEWQNVGSPILFWWGFMQPPRVTRTPMDGIDGAIQTISVTAENAFFNRSRPPNGRYTDRDQQKRSPGDKFFQFTPSLLYATFPYPDY